MSDSRTVELGERIAHALAERRPPPSSDFEARLARASEPVRPSGRIGLLAAAAVALAMFVVLVTRPGPRSTPAPIDRSEQPEGQPKRSVTPAPNLPHGGKYTANQCGQCHRPAPAPPASHAPTGSFPLLGGHRTVPCVSCHAGDKPLERACSSCHMPGSWQLKK